MFSPGEIVYDDSRHCSIKPQVPGKEGVLAEKWKRLVVKDITNFR